MAAMGGEFQPAVTVADAVVGELNSVHAPVRDETRGVVVALAYLGSISTCRSGAWVPPRCVFAQNKKRALAIVENTLELVPSLSHLLIHDERGERCCIGHPMLARLLLLRVADRRADGKGHDLPRTALLRVRAQVEAFLTDTLFAEPESLCNA